MAITWKEELQGKIREDWARDIDNFEAQMHLRKQGKIEDRVFAEQRLRRGTYGQRYDNGRRHDGIAQHTLPYSSLTKGPETFWDAPGMLRIKLPFGGMNPVQMRVLADLAEEYSDSICHVTTRQDIQLHYVHIEDAPTLYRRLAAVGVTTKEACGNSVRNVTACPLAGVCNTEAFDVTPYANATAFYLLGHPDTQDFGRKFKIAFSGCKHEACGLVSIHDLGGIAVTRTADGKTQRGFELYVGGGLGAVPHQAKLLFDFLPEEDLLPVSRAIGRVFGRLGEKKNRQKARLKFVVHKLGIEKFKQVVVEEWKTMPDDPSWRKFFDEIPRYEEKPAFASVPLTINGKKPEGIDDWARTNVYRQRQPGFATVTVTLPLGDLTSVAMRKLADLTHKYASDHARTTVDQNIVLRWIKEDQVAALYRDLKEIGLGQGGAGTIVDVTSCPGTDTCKLGIASSRGLAGELRTRLAAKSASLDDAIRDLHIKVSGCFNSCGQHHVADLGFYGNSRNVAGFTVPHFQVMIGGRWRDNGGTYGLAIGSIPSHAIPTVVERLTSRYVKDRQAAESFQDFCARVGKKELKAAIDDLAKVPPRSTNPEFYSDWGDPREFTIGDMGEGECAGEVVSLTEFGFTAAESTAFEAQLLLDEGQYARAEGMAYESMLQAAKTLVQLTWPDAPTAPDAIVNEFKTRFLETKIFWDTYHAGQFANYLLNRHAEGPDTRYTQDTVHAMVEEANLFIDAAHKAEAKYRQSLNVLGAT
ncbi:MAG TPA: nitrite/sulfite reductase [Tepidisphaeraceae bacterium]|jgi:sulfite reductase (ferredoxin)|nr:nitrite/sulfite reductase [Tepidisphaeraceae bacterium]